MENLNLFKLQERTQKPLEEDKPIEPTKPLDDDFIKDKDIDDIDKRVRDIREEESQEEDKKEGQ